MSDFPPGYSDVPPGSGGPPRSGDLFDPGLPPPGRDPEAARRRVLAPAIFLIVVGVVNAIAGAILLFDAFSIKSNEAAAQAAVTDAWQKMEADQRAELEKQGWTPTNMVTFLGNTFLWGGGAFGHRRRSRAYSPAIRMVSLRFLRAERVRIGSDGHTVRIAVLSRGADRRHLGLDRPAERRSTVVVPLTLGPKEPSR